MDSEAGVLFSCGDCPKVFNKRMDYNRHRKSHQRPHKCSICDKSFGLKTDRDRHRTIHNTHAFKFMCKFPGCRFKGTSRRDNLLTHMRRAHERTETSTSKKSIQFYYQQASNEEQVSQVEERGLNLLEAAGQGDEERAKELISMGANLLARDSSGTTVGGLAATRGHLKILQLLVGKGVDLNSDKSYHWFRLALRNGHLDAAEFLLKSGVDVNAKPHYNQTAFEEATRRGAEDEMRLLHRLGASAHSGKGLQSLFHETVQYGKDSTVAVLLEFAWTRNELHLLFREAVLHGKESTLVLLFEFARAGNEIQLFFNETIRHGKDSTVELLVPFFQAMTELQPLFHEAIWHRTEYIVGLLIESGVSIDSSWQLTSGGTQGKQPPLQTAVETGRVQIAKLLLDLGGESKANSSLEETALLLAIRKGHPSMAALLLENIHGIYSLPRTWITEHSSIPLLDIAMNTYHRGGSAALAVHVSHGQSSARPSGRDVTILLHREIFDEEMVLVKFLLRRAAAACAIEHYSRIQVAYRSYLSKGKEPLLDEMRRLNSDEGQNWGNYVDGDHIRL